MPLFSVVIPVYNRANLIKGTLDSVFAQTERDYEVIVVDDGSTDATADVVKSYGDCVRYVYQENAGPGTARNRGIQLAGGQYVVFLDSDDRWFPWTLEAYRAAIEQHGFPSFLGGSLYVFSDDEELNHVVPEEVKFEVYGDYLEAAGKGVFVGSGMAAAKRAVLIDIGGFTERRINAEDHDLALRLGQYPGFVFVKSPRMVGYRIHDGRVSGNLEKLLDGIRYLLDQESIGRYPGGLVRARQRHDVIAQHVRSASMELVRHGWFQSALDLYLETFKWQLQGGRWKYLFGFPFLYLHSRWTGR